MFKLFWVGHEEPEENPHDIEVDIMENEEESAPNEIGQVALDVLECDENVYIVAPIAGVEYEEIDLSLNKTILTIKGTRNQPQEYEIDGIQLKNSECFWGKFIRNIILPENLALNKIKAYMHNNLLVITIPKLKFDSKSIKINKIES